MLKYDDMVMELLIEEIAEVKISKDKPMRIAIRASLNKKIMYDEILVALTKENLCDLDDEILEFVRQIVASRAKSIAECPHEKTGSELDKERANLRKYLDLHKYIRNILEDRGCMSLRFAS